MKITFHLIVCLGALMAGAQDIPPPTIKPPMPAMPAITVPSITPPAITPGTPLKPAKTTSSTPVAVETEEESAEETSQPAASVAAPSAPVNAETNAPPPEDPAKHVIACFGFDDNIQSSPAGSPPLAINFNRPSAAYADGKAFNENQPRFVEGKFGKALLLESAYANLFSIAQSSAAEPGAFAPLQGAALSIATEQPWQGKEALAVATKGENSEEGFSVEAAVEQACYAKEMLSAKPAIVAACYVASLYLRGDGTLKIMLKDSGSGTSGEPVYASLTPDWQRFNCVFGYKFNRKEIGPNHEGDWKASVSNIRAKLQLICATVDSSKMSFWADGLQLEQRHLEGNVPELSQHSWVLGAFQTRQEQLAIDLKNEYFKALKKNGSLAFWFKPLWEARDSSPELIFQIATNQMQLAHNNNKIAFSPAGVAFAPSDWKNNWHHLAATWNEAGERTLYVDGLDYPNVAGEAAPLKGLESILLGDFTRNLSPNGAFDELTIYNMTLNADQVKALAAAEPKPAPPAPAATPPVAPQTTTPAASQTEDEESEEE